MIEDKTLSDKIFDDTLVRISIIITLFIWAVVFFNVLNCTLDKHQRFCEPIPIGEHIKIILIMLILPLGCILRTHKLKGG
jgi:hypothetical protein